MSKVPWTLEMYQKRSEPLTEEEYEEWMKDAEIAEPFSFTSTSFNGPHEGSTIIIKNGKFYEMINGFCVAGFFGSGSCYEKSIVRDGYERWWAIKELCFVPGQCGEGI